MLTNLLSRIAAATGAPDLINRERPPLESSKTELAPANVENVDQRGEYARLAASLGIANTHIDADLRIERFKEFLRKKDWAVYTLSSVVEYMDKKAEEESAAKAGWRWRPLREKDHLREVEFGHEAWHIVDMLGKDHKRAASDHYRGPSSQTEPEVRMVGMWAPERDKRGRPASAEAYDKLVPLHALRKVDAIEREFKEPVAFFVCDYAPAPHIQYPDPFLMAVIDNPRLREGVGRFVIDFWDEPGFGIERQLGA